jgi:hypothetical protein
MTFEAVARDIVQHRRSLSVRPGRRLLHGRTLRIERHARAALGAELVEGLLERRVPALPGERLHEELHPIRLLVRVIAIAVKHADDGLGDVQHLASRQEVVQQVARLAHDRGPAAHRHAEATLHG